MLGRKNSPLRPNGDGLQSVYLAEVDRPLDQALYRLIEAEAHEVADVAKAVGAAERVSPAREPTLEEWERRVEVDIEDDRTIPETERQALILARRGQGQFRANVLTIERACRVTKVERPEHRVRPSP